MPKAIKIRIISRKIFFPKKCNSLRPALIGQLLNIGLKSLVKKRVKTNKETGRIQLFGFVMKGMRKSKKLF